MLTRTVLVATSTRTRGVTGVVVYVATSRPRSSGNGQRLPVRRLRMLASFKLSSLVVDRGELGSVFVVLLELGPVAVWSSPSTEVFERLAD